MKAAKIAVVSAICLFCAIASVNAADVYDGAGSLKDGPGPYSAPITWAGFYLGGHLGGTFDDELNRDGLTFDVDDSLTGGVHVGYNWLTGAGLVYGFEVDFGVIGDEVNNGVITADLVTSYIWTLRGRLGYALGNTLLYGTGGLALIDFDDDLSDELGGDLDDPSVGWVAGAGVEHKFTQNWSVGVEGLYYDVSSDIGGSKDQLDRDFWAIRGRVTYYIQRLNPLK